MASNDKLISEISQTTNGRNRPQHSTPDPDHEEHSLSLDLSSTGNQTATISNKGNTDHNTEDAASESYQTDSDFESSTTLQDANESTTESSLGNKEHGALTAWHHWLLKKEQDKRKTREKISEVKVQTSSLETVESLRKKLLVLEGWISKKDEEHTSKFYLEKEKTRMENERQLQKEKIKEEKALHSFEVWTNKKNMEAIAKKKIETENKKLSEEMLLVRQERNRVAYEKWILRKRRARPTSGSSTRLQSKSARETVVKLTLHRNGFLQLQNLG